ncbi:MAG: glycosyltransferase N-terminal domain-containing protein [Pseudomonadota bacterium]
MPLGLTLYAMLTRLVAPATGWLLNRRVRAGKEDPDRRNERRAENLPPRPDGTLMWMHAASVGESQIQLAVAHEALKARPGLSVLFTCQTQTAAGLIVSRFASDPVLAQNWTQQHMAPLDTPAIAERFIDHWRPEIAVFAESEIWPNLLSKFRKAGGKSALINARMTERSIVNWQRWGGTAKQVFGGFDVILAADLQTATGLTVLAGREVSVAGNLKSALPPPEADPVELNALQAQLKGRPVLLAASTHPSEEALLLDAVMQMSSRPFVILAPRHPERGDDIRRLIDLSNLSVAQRSEGETITADTDILLADTIGEMGMWYRLADTVYLGGGHAAGVGGHNPLEALLLGKPVLTGPSVFNFKDMMATLAAKGGVQFVSDSAELNAAWPAKPPPPELIAELQNGAHGPMRTTLDAILPLIPMPSEVSR